jgi:hypothetical protein
MAGQTNLFSDDSPAQASFLENIKLDKNRNTPLPLSFAYQIVHIGLA